MHGEYEGRTWYNSTGYFIGTFEQPLFGIPATGKTLYLRYTEMVCVENDQITESYMIPDFIDAMNQAGSNPLRKSLGHDGLVPSPATSNGIQHSVVSLKESEKSAQLVEDMLSCLGRFDGQDLFSMDLETTGTMTLCGTAQQVLARRAVSKVSVTTTKHHSCSPSLIEVSILRSIFWPKMTTYPQVVGHICMVLTLVTVAGSVLPQPEKHIELRVMDIWRREGDLLKENWVAIDIVHILLQLGYDVFAQMKEQLEGPNYA